MSTATVHHPHRLTHPIAMAAAAVVVVGGATAFGIAASQDSSTAPVAPPHAPAAPVHGGASGALTPKGGHTVTGEL